MLLFSFLAISRAKYKGYMIYRISFSKFSDILPAFTCARAIGNLCSLYLGISILRQERCSRSKTVAVWSNISRRPVLSIGLIGNILLSKPLKTISVPAKNAHRLLRVSLFCSFPMGFSGFAFFLNP